jgi:hypothetical protein
MVPAGAAIGTGGGWIVPVRAPVEADVTVAISGVRARAKLGSLAARTMASVSGAGATAGVGSVVAMHFDMGEAEREIEEEALLLGIRDLERV